MECVCQSSDTHKLYLGSSGAADQGGYSSAASGVRGSTVVYGCRRPCQRQEPAQSPADGGVQWRTVAYGCRRPCQGQEQAQALAYSGVRWRTVAYGAPLAPRGARRGAAPKDGGVRRRTAAYGGVPGGTQLQPAAAGAGVAYGSYSKVHRELTTERGGQRTPIGVRVYSQAVRQLQPSTGLTNRAWMVSVHQVAYGSTGKLWAVLGGQGAS